MEEPRKYDLEERTERFSISIRNYCLQLKKDIINREYVIQLVRSAGSVAANYIEANENLGPNDLRMRIKICRKESKESRLWLKHTLICEDEGQEQTRLKLIQESMELERIFGSILRKLA